MDGWASCSGFSTVGPNPINLCLVVTAVGQKPEPASIRRPARRAIGAAVVGISVDDVESHKEFSDKYKLPFVLLADENHETANAYGVLRDYKLIKLASRQSFLVNPEGKIAKHYDEVDPDTHTEEVLADIKAFMESADSPG